MYYQEVSPYILTNIFLLGNFPLLTLGKGEEGKVNSREAIALLNKCKIQIQIQIHVHVQIKIHVQIQMQIKYKYEGGWEAIALSETNTRSCKIGLSSKGYGE